MTACIKKQTPAGALGSSLSSPPPPRSSSSPKRGSYSNCWPSIPDFSLWFYHLSLQPSALCFCSAYVLITWSQSYRVLLHYSLLLFSVPHESPPRGVWQVPSSVHFPCTVLGASSTVNGRSMLAGFSLLPVHPVVMPAHLLVCTPMRFFWARTTHRCRESQGVGVTVFRR